jgi:WhiB family redox-sensing transcriptional regulator
MTIKQPGARPSGRRDVRWRDDAACRVMPPELFFPAGTSGAALENIDAAKAVCNACPVQNACLRFAFETKQEDGIWGGTTEVERRRLRRAWLADRRRLAKMSA